MAEPSVTQAKWPTEPEWMPVRSSNIEAIAWHDDELLVRFQSGSEYRYTDATPAQYAMLAGSPSPGSVFAKHIRGSLKGEPR